MTPSQTLTRERLASRTRAPHRPEAAVTTAPTATDLTSEPTVVSHPQAARGSRRGRMSADLFRLAVIGVTVVYVASLWLVR